MRNFDKSISSHLSLMSQICFVYYFSDIVLIYVFHHHYYCYKISFHVSFVCHLSTSMSRRAYLLIIITTPFNNIKKMKYYVYNILFYIYFPNYNKYIALDKIFIFIKVSQFVTCFNLNLCDNFNLFHIKFWNIFRLSCKFNKISETLHFLNPPED